MSGAASAPPMRLLEWDSGFFGFPIARVEPAALAAGGIERWCRKRDVACAYLLVDAGDHASMRLAATQQFRAVAIRLTLTATREPRPPKFQGTVRRATAGDIPVLRAIAAQAHRDSRFYADGRFDRVRCDELFAYWIQHSCQGWASHVIVFDHQGEASGYVTVHDRGRHADIGLVGVHEGARGLGGAAAMLAACRQWCAVRELSPLTVVTQGSNRAALALYASAGFDVTHLQLWYHRWFTNR